MTKMMTITEGKAKFSELLDLVGSGEEVIITKHGKPVAKVVPFKKPKIVFGLLEGKYPGLDNIDFDDTSHMDEAWAKWRRKLDGLEL